MRISGDWISAPGFQALCALLETAGYQALAVGGCLRNSLMSRPVTDVDMATDAPPQTVLALAKAGGFRAIPTGIEHGTVTVLAFGDSYEITTFRRDVETDGRHATVAFSQNITEDAQRRDLTINALYADRRGKVIDPLGGMDDIFTRHIRFVGVPEARIREDYLRILRFFRFHACYGDPELGFDAEAIAACSANSAGIETVSRERIGAEMRKLLAADNPAPTVACMAQTGILARVLPGADPRALPVLVHLEAESRLGGGDIAPRWLRRLAVIGGEDPRGQLRLSRSEAKDLGQLRTAIGDPATPAALGWMLGRDLGEDAALARAALLQMPLAPALAQDWRAEVERGSQSRLPVSAADLQPALQGAALGQRLRELQSRWLASDLRLDRAQLLHGRDPESRNDL